MDPDFPDFGMSPVLGASARKLEYVATCNHNKMSLEDVHRRLTQHLKSREIIPRDELKSYLEQTNKMNSGDHKNHWLLVKIRGLLNYILKKRSDIRCSNVEGQMTIYERSASEQIRNDGSSVQGPQEFQSQPNTESFNLPSNFLTNDNFVTASSNQKPIKMETENSYNYSQDLFSDTLGALHNASQANYQMLKHLTDHADTSTTSEDSDYVFKVPKKLEKVFKIHDKVEENYDALFSLTPSLPMMSQDTATCDVNMGSSQFRQSQSFGNFDDLTISNEELKEEFDNLLEYAESWVSEIANNLVHLQVSDHRNSFSIPNENAGHSSTFDDGPANASDATEYSEENLKILREVSSEFKKNLEEEMKSNKKLEILKHLLSPSDLPNIG